MANKKENTTLAAEVSALQIINLNGTNYLGNLEKSEGGFLLSKAIECVSSFEESVKEWIRKNNLNALQSLSIEGENVSVVRKDFTEQQRLEIGIIAAKADYAIKYAVSELQNSKI